MNKGCLRTFFCMAVSLAEKVKMIMTTVSPQVLSKHPKHPDADYQNVVQSHLLAITA